MSNPIVFNLCPHEIQLKQIEDNDPLKFQGQMPLLVYKPYGMWRCSKKAETIEPILDVRTEAPAVYTLDPLPVTLPLDSPVVLLVSMLAGDCLEQMTPEAAQALFQGHTDVTVISPGAGPEECVRDEKGQILHSLVVKKYTPGAKCPSKTDFVKNLIVPGAFATEAQGILKRNETIPFFRYEEGERFEKLLVKINPNEIVSFAEDGHHERLVACWHNNARNTKEESDRNLEFIRQCFELPCFKDAELVISIEPNFRSWAYATKEMLQKHYPFAVFVE